MKTILVVEDDPMIRDVLSRLLRIEGYNVITADDGIQGVQRARINHPDLIIMDMGLPQLNGWQATHRIRSMPATKHIPIIALTAYAMKEDRAKCLGVGCNEYEPKPVDFSRLAEKIRLLLNSPVSKADLASDLAFLKG
ncbi:MAG: response regulator [Chloroflexaceae bacterium]|nr:response regulator [Chloroflexaceae bacterium]